MAVIKRQTTLLLGGDKGRRIKIEKGDLLRQILQQNAVYKVDGLTHSFCKHPDYIIR